jgi:sugar lactone lactonase YvrE
MESGIFALTFTAEGLLRAERLAAPTFPMPDMRFNDGRCDRQGRFWAGTMHMDTKAGHPVGALYRYDGAGGLVGPVQDGLRIQNGLAFSPSGDRMYLSDSNRDACVIWCFDYDIDAGLPSNRRVFVDMKQHRGRPDGAAVDEEGCYWTCASDGACLLRFTPEGVLDRSVELPVSKPTMCAFGGSGYETLFVTSMQPAPGLPRAEDGSDGAVFALRPGVRGMPETDFAG